MCGSRPTSAQPVVDEIIAAGKKAVAIQLNVLDAISIEETFKNIANENEGHIDILVNSAGGSARGKANNVVEQDVDVFDEILNINLRGAMICAKEAANFINGVAPGIVQRGEVTMDAMERLGNTNWMRTFGKPEDISAVVNFLCKEEASFVTGQNIAVDGGRSLGLKES